MAWNGPIGGTDYSNCDWTQAPWAPICATLTHEEVLYVIEALPPIEAKYLPDTNMVIGQYNQLTSYEKAINGQTYPVIKQYDPEVNTLGIDVNGIVPEEVSSEPLPDEEPASEAPSEPIEQPGEEVTPEEEVQPSEEV